MIWIKHLFCLSLCWTGTLAGLLYDLMNNIQTTEEVSYATLTGWAFTFIYIIFWFFDWSLRHFKTKGE